MSDIVDDLRRKHEMWALGQKGPQILLDAAAEIERLRAALETIAGSTSDKLQAIHARQALPNI